MHSINQHNIPPEAKKEDYFARKHGVCLPWAKLFSNPSTPVSAIIEQHNAEPGGLMHEGRAGIFLCLDEGRNNEFMSVSCEFWLIVGGVDKFRGVVLVEVGLLAQLTVGVVGDVAGGEVDWDNWVITGKIVDNSKQLIFRIIYWAVIDKLYVLVSEVGGLTAGVLVVGRTVLSSKMEKFRQALIPS